jgi:hypothetical protein
VLDVETRVRRNHLVAAPLAQDNDASIRLVIGVTLAPTAERDVSVGIILLALAPATLANVRVSGA